MDEILTNVNWLAVIVRTLVAYGLCMLWFGPVFGKVWAAGSHGIQPPLRLPPPAMAVQLFGTFLMAWVIGATAAINALGTAIVIIVAITALQLAESLFSQKSPAAAFIDGGFVVAMGAMIIVAQGLL